MKRTTRSKTKAKKEQEKRKNRRRALSPQDSSRGGVVGIMRKAEEEQLPVQDVLGQFDEPVEEERSRIQEAPEQIDKPPSFELEKLGGIYLSWGKRRVRQEDGTCKVEYYLRREEEHRIWVKWTQAFPDGKEWSAVQQQHLDGVLPKNKQKALQDKMIFPYPSHHDGPDSGWRERKEICKRLGYTPWRPRNNKKSAKYKLKMPEDHRIETDEESDEESTIYYSGEE